MLDVQSILNRLKQHEGKICLDVETSGLNPRKNHIVAYVLTFGPTPNDTYYIPVRHAGGGNINNQVPPPSEAIANTKVLPFEHEFAKIARDKTWEIIAHNAIFDLLFMAHHGITFNNATFSCTQVRQPLVDEYTPSFSLDSSARHMGVTEKKGDELYKHIGRLFDVPADRKSMAHYWKLAGNDPIAVDYAMGDGVSTWELYGAQQKRIDEEELGVVWKLEQRTTKTLFRMQHKGIRIDRAYMEEARERLLKECDVLRKPFLQFGDEDGFKERSAAQVEKAYRAAGYKDEDFLKTPTGKNSFVEEWMQTNDLGQQILTIRRNANIVNTFIGPLLDEHMVGDYAFPNYAQLRGEEFGTISGRLSSFSPNVQQIPKHEEEASKMIRRGFLPSNGYFWSSKDAKSCEPRIFAQYTGSKFLIDGYMQKPPIDLYSNLSKITGESRQRMKKLALALFYSAGNTKAASLIGCSVEEAVKYRNQVRQQIPEIEKFNKSAENNVRQRARAGGVGYVKTVTGRRLRFNELRFAYKAGNRIVQGSNADYIKNACNNMSDYLESTGKGRLLLSCHDSADCEIQNGQFKIDDEVTKIMEDSAHDDVIKFTIPQEAECGRGANWAEASWGK